MLLNIEQLKQSIFSVPVLSWRVLTHSVFLWVPTTMIRFSILYNNIFQLMCADIFFLFFAFLQTSLRLCFHIFLVETCIYTMIVTTITFIYKIRKFRVNAANWQLNPKLNETKLIIESVSVRFFPLSLFSFFDWGLCFLRLSSVECFLWNLRIFVCNVKMFSMCCEFFFSFALSLCFIIWYTAAFTELNTGRFLFGVVWRKWSEKK